MGRDEVSERGCMPSNTEYNDSKEVQLLGSLISRTLLRAPAPLSRHMMKGSGDLLPVHNIYTRRPFSRYADSLGQS